MMFRKLFFAIAFGPVLLQAQKNYPLLLDQYMQAQVQTNDFSGTVLVAHNGKIIYKKAAGLADREWNIANTIETKFRIGSITKQFTASAILQLVEAGKLGLDDKLSRFIPDFPKGDSVTVHMLLNHTSGIKSYTDLPIFPSIAPLPYSRDSVISLFKSVPYDFSPGTEYRYNNSGYFLLGYIIEKITGESYSDYLYKNVIQRAGLKNTFADQLDSIILYRARGYSNSPTGWKNAFHISMEFPFSAGVLISTVDDLYQWDKNLLGGKIISKAMLGKMTTPYLENYGYGLGIDSFQHHKRIAHSGGIPGFVSFLGDFPNDDLQVVVLSNNNSSSPGIADGLSAIVLDLPVILPYKHKAITLKTDQLTKYTGRYRTEDNLTLELLLIDGKLFRRFPGSPDVALIPESDRKFYYGNGADNQIEFVLGKTGEIIDARLIRSGIATTLKKID